MAIKHQGRQDFKYSEFTTRLRDSRLNEGQQQMLRMRLQLLESFMCLPEGSGIDQCTGSELGLRKKPKSKAGNRQQEEEISRMRAKMGDPVAWSFEPGSLTIVDLSCPFIDESTACALFNICLAIFLEHRPKAGCIVALDEAHKVCISSDPVAWRNVDLA